MTSRIVFLAHALKAGGGISVGQNLIRAFREALPEGNYWATVPENLGFEEFIGRQVRYLPFHQRNSLQQWRYENHTLPRLVGSLRPHLVLALGNRALAPCPVAQYLLVHDAHLFYSSRYYARESRKRRWLKALQRRRLTRDLGRIDGLMLQTGTAEERLRSRYGFKGRVVRLPNAVSVDVNPDDAAPLPPAYAQHGAATRLFYLTRYYAHKNIELLLEAYRRHRGRLSNTRLFLTIASSQHPGARRALEFIQQHRLHDLVINLGPLPQTDIAPYLLHAQALVMPTTLESFSGTYLEAMACGTPIATSDLDFAREICGNAALYFDPWSCESLVQAIEKLAGDAPLRQALIGFGRSRLAQLQWDWDKNAHRLLDELERAHLL